MQLGTTSDSKAQVIEEKIKQMDERLSILDRQRRDLEHTSEAFDQQYTRREVFAELMRIDLNELWTWDQRRINQMLHCLFGRVRLVLLNGEIIRLKANNR
ncbi:MAG: hypothetical protein IT324_13435 [Anaerolineae bacterium]|nr:hypothetical protein [Anaerolineae bacterium]